MESGATAWEVRTLMKSIELCGAQIPIKIGLTEEYGTAIAWGDMPPMSRAILVEALELLAEKKEREKQAA